MADVLKDIHELWDAERASVKGDSVLCLFVDKFQDGKMGRGRLKKLRGLIVFREKGSRGNEKSDTITFDNQIKTPDDPFIGVSYDSLAAVRKVLLKTGFKHKTEGAYHSYFSIEGSKNTFTGDSIGLALGLIAYTQLIIPEVTRQHRFIANGVALTGALDSDGNVLPVNMETLLIKIDRAFFRPVKCAVVPEKCYAEARRHVDELSENIRAGS